MASARRLYLESNRKTGLFFNIQKHQCCVSRNRECSDSMHFVSVSFLLFRKCPTEKMHQPKGNILVVLAWRTYSIHRQSSQNLRILLRIYASFLPYIMAFYAAISWNLCYFLITFLKLHAILWHPSSILSNKPI